MNKYIIGALVLVLVGGGLAAKKLVGQASTVKSEPLGASAKAAPSKIELAPSDIFTVTPTQIARRIPLTGTIKAANQSIVKSKSAGDIIALSVREGMAVTKGQVLVQIDRVELDMRAKERVAILQSNTAALVQAKRAFENNQALVEKGFISPTALDTSKAQYDAAIANRNAAQTQLDLARKAAGDTLIIAPISGIISERFVQVGEKVLADARLLSIIDLSRLEIEAPVPADDVSLIRIGQTISLSVEGLGNLGARVVRINPAAAAGTRSIVIYLSIDNPAKSLGQARVGQFAQGNLSIAPRAGIIAVPVAAIRDNVGRQFVYVISNNMIAERTVKLGQRDDGDGGGNAIVEITDGLVAGDKVVATNLGILNIGAPVISATAISATPVSSTPVSSTPVTATAPSTAPLPTTTPAK